MTRSLIDAGADVNHQNKDGNTAFKIAERRGHTEVEEALIEGGAGISFWRKLKRSILAKH